MAAVAGMTVVADAATRHGPGRWHIDEPVGRALADVALGHGAGGGVESPDLAVVTRAMVAAGFRVGRFEQPWRVAGRRVGAPPVQLDAAWCDALPRFTSGSSPLVVGGRSAGARVACRTAERLGAPGVLALAFPLHPPGRPDRSRLSEIPSIPVLVVQGGRDSFGGAAEVVEAGHALARLTVLAVPGADHSLRVWKQGPITQAEADEVVAVGTRRWARSVMQGNHR